MSVPISFNRNVSRDLDNILAFYEEEGGIELADKFSDLPTIKITPIRENP